MSVNEDIRDQAIARAVYLQKFSNGLASRLLELLNSNDDRLVEAIAGKLSTIEERGVLLTPATRNELSKLLSTVQQINSEIYSDFGESLNEELKGLLDVEARFQATALETALPITYAAKVPSQERLIAILNNAPMDGSLLSSWLKGMEEGRVTRINQEIRKGLINSETTDQIVRRIRGTKAGAYKDGVLEISRRSATSIVRTASAHVANVASQATWKANSDVVKGWQFVATFDSRTTLTCASHNGNVYPIGEGPIPPLHIRCRSLSIAVTKSYREMGFDKDEIPKGAKASMDGQIANDVSFDQWLKGRDSDVQDKMLGKAKAELFRQGKVSLADLVADDGSVLTLDQLKKMGKA